jgi:hypothetical protein
VGRVVEGGRESSDAATALCIVLASETSEWGSGRATKPTFDFSSTRQSLQLLPVTLFYRARGLEAIPQEHGRARTGSGGVGVGIRLRGSFLISLVEQAV